MIYCDAMERAANNIDLISAVQGVALTLAKLHRESAEWSSTSESVVDRLRIAMQ
jgi:hypothetical protein